jgi:hypothetical protein
MAEEKKVKVRLPKKELAAAAKAVAEEIQGEQVTAELVQEVQGEPLSRELLFAKARLGYITDLHQRAVEAFWPQMEGTMSPHAFVKRATNEGWEAQRRKIWAMAQAELARRISKQVVKDQMAEVQELMQVRSWLFKLIAPSERKDDDGNTVLEFPVEPKSLEGVVKAYKDISVLLTMTRQHVLQVIEPQAPAVEDAGSGAMRAGPLTREDAGDVARSIMTRSLKKRRGLSLPEHTDDEGEDPA